jgi:rubrerythrin
MYPPFAEVARQEGFEDVAKAFEAIAVAEKQHEKHYIVLADNIADGKVFQKDEPVVWRCLNCGYLHEETGAPRPTAGPVFLTIPPANVKLRWGDTYLFHFIK